VLLHGSLPHRTVRWAQLLLVSSPALRDLARRPRGAPTAPQPYRLHPRRSPQPLASTRRETASPRGTDEEDYSYKLAEQYPQGSGGMRPAFGWSCGIPRLDCGTNHSPAADARESGWVARERGACRPRRWGPVHLEAPCLVQEAGISAAGPALAPSQSA